uniref:Uncharacterized protein n=1 Tax=Brassica oleracea var. oleracea TaxID=109376 RepID=A0A0D3CNM5_BRAOL
MVEYGRPDLRMMVQGVGTNLINECIGWYEQIIFVVWVKSQGRSGQMMTHQFQVMKGQMYMLILSKTSQRLLMSVGMGFSTERNALLVVSYTSIFDGHFSVTTGFVSITPTVTGLCLLHPPLELTFFVYVFLNKPELISPHSLTASVATRLQEKRGECDIEEAGGSMSYRKSTTNGEMKQRPVGRLERLVNESHNVVLLEASSRGFIAPFGRCVAGKVLEYFRLRLISRGYSDPD